MTPQVYVSQIQSAAKNIHLPTSIARGRIPVVSCAAKDVLKGGMKLPMQPPVCPFIFDDVDAWICIAHNYLSKIIKSQYYQKCS